MSVLVGVLVAAQVKASDVAWAAKCVPGPWIGEAFDGAGSIGASRRVIGDGGGCACGISHPALFPYQRQNISLEISHLDAGLDAGARQRNG